MLILSLGQEDPLEKGMATHSCILAWRIPMDRGAWRATVCRAAKSQTRLKRLGTHARTCLLHVQRVGRDWSDSAHTHARVCCTCKESDATEATRHTRTHVSVVGTAPCPVLRLSSRSRPLHPLFSISSNSTPSHLPALAFGGMFWLFPSLSSNPTSPRGAAF